MSSVSQARPVRRFSLGRIDEQRSLLVIFIALALIVIASSALSPTFRTSYNALNVLRQAVALGIVALGQTFVIITGGIDLSVGSTISVVACFTAGFMMGRTSRMVPVIVAMLALGAFIGFFNGYVSMRTKVAPFIVTLGMQSIAQGIALMYTKNPVGKIPKPFKYFAEGQWGPIPFPVILFVILAVVVFFVLRSTTFGRYVYAAGGNEEVARLSGINTSYIKTMVYVLSGLSAAVAGMFLASRMGVGDPLVGQRYDLDSITAVLIGGTTFAGGRGGVVGTVIGVLIMALLSNVLNLMNINSYWQWIIKGIIIVGALAVYRSRRG
jgi:ribose transport system permease protein